MGCMKQSKEVKKDIPHVFPLERIYSKKDHKMVFNIPIKEIFTWEENILSKITLRQPESVN